MNQAFFVITMAICIMNLVTVISIMTGKPVKWPRLGFINPTNFLFFYPSIAYQVWFWFHHYGVI